MQQVTTAKAHAKKQESVLDSKLVEALAKAMDVHHMSAQNHAKYNYYVPVNMGLCMDTEYACAESPDVVFKAKKSSNAATSFFVYVASFVMRATWKITQFIANILGRLFTGKPVNLEVAITPDGPHLIYALNADRLKAAGLPEQG